MKPLPSLEYLKTVLNVDLDTGVVTWRERRNCRAGRAVPGAIAGWDAGKGYRSVTVDQKDIKIHRLVWLFGTGNWPQGHIDHINGHRSDNRFCNLREATQAQNLQNHHGMRTDNKSGVKGVSFDVDRKKWAAHISVNRKHLFLGRFDTIEEAAEAYRKARLLHHPTAHELTAV